VTDIFEALTVLGHISKTLAADKLTEPDKFDLIQAMGGLITHMVELDQIATSLDAKQRDALKLCASRIVAAAYWAGTLSARSDSGDKLAVTDHMGHARGAKRAAAMEQARLDAIEAEAATPQQGRRKRVNDRLKADEKMEDSTYRRHCRLFEQLRPGKLSKAKK